MQTPEEFRSFYDRELLPSLQNLEADRKKLINGAFKWIPLGLIPGLIPLFMSGSVDLFWFAVGIAITAGVYLVVNYKKIGEIKTRFKCEVIAKMVKSIDPSLAYNSSQCISSNDYHKSKLTCMLLIDIRAMILLPV